MKQFEFTTLKLFLAVADCGSLTMAADKCNIAIAALSKRISDMEASAGTRFFERRARGMSLTPAGRALLQHAREILYGVERMQSDLLLYSRGFHGMLRIAATASAVSEFLPEALRSFSQEHPEVALDLSEGTSQQVVEAVLDGRADLGIFLEPVPGNDLATFPYRRDELCVVLPRGHVLARQAHVSFADTLRHDHIGTQTQSSLTQTLMAEGGVDYRVRIRVGSFDAACRMVQAGLGICIAPRLIVENYRECFSVETVPLDEPWAVRQMWVGVRSEQGLSGAAHAFLHRCIEAGERERRAFAPGRAQGHGGAEEGGEPSRVAKDPSHEAKHTRETDFYDAFVPLTARTCA
jgi:DNA-binding transcriptional LysR family regulator